MNSPSGVRVAVDAQGRMVLPKGWREGVVDIPGSVMLRRTSDGLLLTRVPGGGSVDLADDGLPLLSVGRPVSTAEVAEAIDSDRARR